MNREKTMQTPYDLYLATRSRFPHIAALADQKFLEKQHEFKPEATYVWFECLADALNREMMNGVDSLDHIELLLFLDQALNHGSESIRDCMSTAFSENLFQQVPKDKMTPYWRVLPRQLKRLYTDFHGEIPA